MSTAKDTKELAYLYDLYIVPGWREAFDGLLDENLKLPVEGRILDAGCGTGTYALDLAVRGGNGVEVVGIDESPERIALANGKLEIKQLENVQFIWGALDHIGSQPEEFDVVIADLSLLAPPDFDDRLHLILKELRRVTKAGGQVILKTVTRGSFDEFYSFYWQALYELGWEELTPQIETLTKERFTVEQLEQAMRDAGFREITSLTETQRLEYESGQEFLTAPLIETIFMERWLAILASADKREQIKKTLLDIIDRDCGEFDFEVSAKFTLVTAQR